MTPWMGTPPSSSGGSQCNLHVLAVTSVHSSGPMGMLGGPSTTSSSHSSSEPLTFSMRNYIEE